MLIEFTPPNAAVVLLLIWTALLIVSGPVTAKMPPLLNCNWPKPSWLVGPEPVVEAVTPIHPPPMAVLPV